MNDPRQDGDGERSAPLSASAFNPSLDQSLAKEIVSKKIERAENF
jgi:hypothetical protein